MRYRTLMEIATLALLLFTLGYARQAHCHTQIVTMQINRLSWISTCMAVDRGDASFDYNCSSSEIPYLRIHRTIMPVDLFS